VIEVKKAIY